MAQPPQPFLWGSGGRALTPEQVARDRELAALLAREGADYSPVGHVTQGLARLANAWSGRAWRDQADADEASGREGYAQRWSNVFGGGGASPVASALAGSPALDAIEGIAPTGQAAPPTGDTAGYIRSGLISRGLPEHVADAFLLNMQDESGLNPGINEARPLVPGSRGGYGLYQLTGPRRRAYEAFAGQRGVSPSDIDAQLDFLMYELQGPEAAAARNILGAQDTGTAAAAIVNDFLRPAAEHRERRAAAYLGGQPLRADASPVAQALGGGMGGYDMNALIELASDPWASPAQQQIVSALMNQQIQAQQQANDPLRQLQIQQAQLQLEQAQNPFQAVPATPEQLAQWGIQPQPGESWTIGQDGLPQQVYAAPGAPAPIEVGGVLLDPVTYQPIFDSRSDTIPSNVREYEFYANQAGENALPFDQWDLARRQSGGTTVNVGDQGQRIGSIPPGYAVVLDPTDPSGFRMEMIGNSPAAREAADAEAMAGMRAEQAGRYADIVLEDIDHALGLTGGDTTGIFGTLLQNVPGTNSRNLDALLGTIRSNIGFDRLQSMREASPTGGALGAVSDFENRQLQSTLGNLEQSQTEDQLRRNLERVRQVYLDIVHGPGNWDPITGMPVPAGPAPQTSSPVNDIDAVVNQVITDRFQQNPDRYNSETPPPDWTGPVEFWPYYTPEERAAWQ